MDETAPPRKELRRIERAGDARALNFTCVNGMPLLRSDRARDWVVRAIDRALTKHNVALWAWCIMPTHLHILVYPRDSKVVSPNMSAFLKSLKQSVARKAAAWTRTYAPEFVPKLIETSPDGTTRVRFWERGGGFDRNLWSAKAIWEMIDYIHRNPVEARLCARSIDWEWSSAADYGHVRKGKLKLDLRSLPPDSRKRR